MVCRPLLLTVFMFLDRIRLTVVCFIEWSTAVAPSCFAMITRARHAWILGWTRSGCFRAATTDETWCGVSAHIGKIPTATARSGWDAARSARRASRRRLPPRRTSGAVPAARPEHARGVQPQLPGPTSATTAASSRSSHSSHAGQPRRLTAQAKLVRMRFSCPSRRWRSRTRAVCRRASTSGVQQVTSSWIANRAGGR
jgi:hypothetical protein